MTQKNNQCDPCGLKDCSYVPMQKVLKPQLSILLIGPMPAGVEIHTKTPFTGPAGKMLWRLLKDVDIDKSLLNITNVVACAPPEDRKPEPSEISLCHQRLKDEIKECAPKLIVAIGEIPATVLTGKSKIQGLRGQFFPLLPTFDHKCEVLCILHPSFVMRQRQWLDIASSDVNEINNYFSPTRIIKDNSKPTFICDPPTHQLTELLEKMSSHTTAIDIETPGQLDILTAEVIGIAFCADEKLAVGVDFTTNGMQGDNWQAVKKFMEDPKARKCAQNAQFDVGVLRSNNIDTKNLAYDTLLAEHTMNSDLPGNLDFLRGRYTDVPQYKPTKASMKQIGSWAIGERLEYNCWDVVATLKVMLAQDALMTGGQKTVLRDIELPLVDICDKMSRKGVKVNIPVLALMYKKLEPQANGLEKEHFAPLGLNPRSPVQLKKFFNLPTTGEEELKKQIKRNHSKADLMQKLLDYRKVQKVVSVYLEGVHNRLRNGRIHSKTKIAGTGTGRLASKDPNLSNVPKPLRVIYVPDDDNYTWLEADYSQLEVRTAAVVANEQTMLSQLAAGIHIHHVMGKLIYKREWEELNAIEKLRTKAVVFGTFYGRSPRSIAMEFGVMVVEAESWQKKCFGQYPGLLTYVKNQAETFYSTGRCVTPFGRVRTLQTITQAYNTPIQSSAADIMLTKLIELDKAGFDVRITVYDSIMAQVAKSELKDAAVEFKRIMEGPIKQLNNYQFPVSPQSGPNWYNLEEIK